MTSFDRHADPCTGRASPATRAARWVLAVLVVVASVVAVLVPPSASQPAARDADRARLAWAPLHDAFRASATTPGSVPSFEGLQAARPASARPVAVAGPARSPGDGACPARSSATVPAPPFEPKAAGDLPEPEPPRAAGAADPPPPRRAVLASSDPRLPRTGLAPLLRPPRA
jgi:hypothetical protein